MKTITLTQPWATLVAIGAKRFETRSWRTFHKGTLAIHAAKGFPEEAIVLCFEEPFASVLSGAGITKPGDLPRGVIVAVSDLNGCHPTDRCRCGIVPPQPGTQEHAFGDYRPGRWFWELRNVRPVLPPIPVKGAQGLWVWDETGLEENLRG